MKAASAEDVDDVERATGRLARLLEAFRQRGGFSGGGAEATALWAEIQQAVREIDRLGHASARADAEPRAGELV